MARWGYGFNKGAANVQSVALVLAAAANPHRFKIYEWTMGCGASPADNVFIHIAQLCSTVGTGTTLTPVSSLDPADTITTLVCKDTVTADPTLTANTIKARKALNQRATFRWLAAPYGELVGAATANNGFMLGLSAASTSTMDYDCQIEEM